MPGTAILGRRRGPERVPARSELVVAIAGNPNVGKSTLFNQLTGATVDTAHYPGITVEAVAARVEWGAQQVEIIDLPGIYGFGARAKDERLAWETLLARRPHVVVAVADATNLARSLYVTLQLLDLGFPVIVALNLTDEARRREVIVDEQGLQAALGVPVVSTVALRGEGLERVRRAILTAGQTRRPRGEAYSPAIEERLADLAASFAAPGVRCDPACAAICGLEPRGAAFAVLEGFGQVCEIGELAALVEHARCRLPQLPLHDDRTALRLAAERHARAGRIVAAVAGRSREGAGDRLWRFATRPATGVPVLVAVLATVFAVLFFVGEWLSVLLTTAWEAGPAPLLRRLVQEMVGAGAFADTLLWGLDGGIYAALAVGIPYIMTFYLIMALLEDSGYVNAVAYLSDRLMRHVGLQGRAVIPLIAAAGCNVPAIMGARVLTSRRERLIASTLIALMPCSARTAVIVGAVSLYVGWGWALAVYGVIFAVGLSAGLGLNRLLPGQPGALVMEMFPLRRPSPWLVLRKTWARLRDFVWVAAPIIIGGSLLLGALYETGIVWHFSRPLAPLVEGWLGLPAVAGLTLLFAILRKELALQLLIAFAVVVYGSAATNLNAFMSDHQLVVYALVSCLSVPCASTIAVLGREIGWRATFLLAVAILGVALLVGGVAHRLLPLV